MSTVSINVRINEEDKKNFEFLCSELGMNMSTAFSIFVKAMLREKGLPFEVSAKKPNLETLAVFKDVMEGKNLSKEFNSVAELMEDLNA